MSDNGWIKIYRKSLENPVITKDADHFAIWNYLLLKATHKKYKDWFNGKSVMLEPGQLITGRKKIAIRFKISESKVQRVLKCFESEQQIEQLTCSVNRLITIKNWELYQVSEQPNERRVNNKRTTSEQRVNTIQEYKNVKNEKKKDSTSPSASENQNQTEDLPPGVVILPDGSRDWGNVERS